MKQTKTLWIFAAIALIFGLLMSPATEARNIRGLKILNVRDTTRQAAPSAKPSKFAAKSASKTADTAAAEAPLPVLRIGGKVDDNVYLQSLDISVEVTGNIAATRYTMVFKNKTDRVLEGELTFPLPDGKTVSHYALDINGKMRTAVPVEKAKATRVFEEIQQREVDPGILERVEGNNFRTRIYPIPSHGTRTISIGYEEELPLEDDLLYYRLPMAYPDPLEKFSVTATVWKGASPPIVPASSDEIRFDRAGENYVAEFARDNYRPSRALVFALPAPRDIPQVMMQSASGSYYFLASVAPGLSTRKKEWSKDLAVIWDVSLSGTQRNLKREMEMLDIIFKERKDANVHLYFLNNRLMKASDKNAPKGQYRVSGGKWDALKGALDKAVFDGGTDFSQIDLKKIEGSEILFFSDGISTLSDADFIEDAKVNRPVHCVVSSSRADYSAMKLISGKTGGKFVNVSALSANKLKNELLNETLQYLGAEHGDDISEVYPSIATPVHGNFSVAGISGADNAELTLLFGFGNKVERRVKVGLDAARAGASPAPTTNDGGANPAHTTNDGSAVGAPLAGARPYNSTYKIWAQKKIAELDLNFEKNRAELTDLGKQFGIVTRNTSLIVLELISDYIQYEIEPPQELMAEYQRELKWRSERQRAAERDMLKEAVAAADSIRKWWGVESTPAKPKYPVPDSEASRRQRGEERGDEIVLEEVRQPRMSAPASSSAPARNQAESMTDAERQARLNELKRRQLEQQKSRASMSAPAHSPSMDADEEIRSLHSGLDEAPSRSSALAASAPARRSSSSSEMQRLSREESPRSSSSSSTSQTRSSANRSMAFESAEVIGYLDNPTPVYIINMEDANADPITLDRSLREALKENVDKEGFEGVAGESKRWRAPPENRPADVIHTLSVSVSPAGAGKVTWTPGGNQFKPGTDLTLTVETMPGYKFVGWKGWTPDKPTNIKETDHSNIRFKINKDMRLTANFKKYDYMDDLKGNLDKDYQTYLKLRNEYSNSPTFYFDMANWFFKKGDKETALRILTSIADMDLENASLYRLLGYRFKEYGEYALQKFVTKKVIAWRPMEPQSYRDYALALADLGEAQAALDSLYSLLTRSYSENINRRSLGIEEVAVMEMNRLIAKYPGLNTSRIDERLLMNVPVDVRVVINWNMNNVDIDLHVIDPNREECYYRKKETRSGGRISNDNTSGYGPEQFILKNAPKGKYKVFANYYGSREFAYDGPSTVMAEIYTRYADKSETRKVVCLQLNRIQSSRTRANKVEVGEFEFK